MVYQPTFRELDMWAQASPASLQVFRHMSREWSASGGEHAPDIYMPAFKALQILLPPIQEQEKIGEIGEAFDRRIEA